VGLALLVLLAVGVVLRYGDAEQDPGVEPVQGHLGATRTAGFGPVFIGVVTARVRTR
jgi:hypothetical protein